MKAFPTNVEIAFGGDKAMQGLLASDVHANMYQFAAKAYEVADAMLEARK
jgi:hypothetical protein